MMTQSGPVCDICGLHIIFDTSINPFTISGIKGTLLCHDKCKKFVEQLIAEQSYANLPDGPLRQAYERVVAS